MHLNWCSGQSFYVLIDWVLGLDGKIFGPMSWRMDQVQRGPSAMTECQIFSRPARPNSVNKHFIIWLLCFSFFFCFCFVFVFLSNQIKNVHLHRSFWPKGQDLYSNKVVLVCISCLLSSQNYWEIVYGPHTGILSIVLQWKRVRGRTGHIIKVAYKLHQRNFDFFLFVGRWNDKWLQWRHAQRLLPSVQRWWAAVVLW